MFGCRGNHSVMFLCSHQTKSYRCEHDGRPSSLTLDLASGFVLYDSISQSVVWSHLFSNLRGSSDDGATCFRLAFVDSENGVLIRRVGL